MTTFTIGCDPEIFLTRGKAPVSAHGVIPGTKNEPHPVPRGAVQVDGMAVEFNTEPVVLEDEAFPLGNFDGFNENIITVMKEMKGLVTKTDSDLGFNIVPVQEFPAELIEEQPKEARELGCNPDFNAYTGKENEAPDGGAVNFRTAAGHIHIGWGEGIPVEHPDHFEICRTFVKYLDCTVGLYMCLIDPEPRRRVLYGKAGAFRPKSYGVEYRTPSNVWLTSKQRRQDVFALSRFAVAAARNEYKAKQFTKLDIEQVRECIDEGQWEIAYKALQYCCGVFYAGHSLLENIMAEGVQRKKMQPKTPQEVKKSRDLQKKVWVDQNQAYNYSTALWSTAGSTGTANF